MKVTQKPGAGRRILDSITRDLDKSNVKVGWFSSSRYNDENNTPVAYVAAINELGPHARPFMRPAADANDVEWSNKMAAFARQVAAGRMTVEQMLTALGLIVEADIRAAIIAVNSPPLSLITLMARKARLDGMKVTGATIGQFAAEIAAKGAENIDVSGVSTKPLNDSGYMLATVTSQTEIKSK